MSDRRYIDYLHAVLADDESELRRKDAEYGGSWLRRGGVGAFMMLARKRDRLEAQHADGDLAEVWARLEARAADHHFDVFAAIAADARSEGVLDDIRDLRRYLALVEAEWCRRCDEGGHDG